MRRFVLVLSALAGVALLLLAVHRDDVRDVPPSDGSEIQEAPVGEPGLMGRAADRPEQRSSSSAAGVAPVPADGLEGIVLDPDGRPIASCLVQIIDHESRRLLGSAPLVRDMLHGIDRLGPSTLTSADGKFLLPKPAVDEVLLRATASGFAPQESGPHRVGATAKIVLKPRPGGQAGVGDALRGRVGDATTFKPVARATVGMGWQQTPRTLTGSTGRYELADWSVVSPPIVHVTAAGYAREFGRVQSGAPLDFALSPGVRVIGRVENESQAGIEGARVVAFAGTETSGRVGTLARSGAIATTNVAGEFLLDGLHLGTSHTLVISARNRGQRVLQFWPHETDSGVTDLGRIFLGLGTGLQGVIYSGGEPLAGATIRVRRANTVKSVGGVARVGPLVQSRASSQLEQESGADGRFEFKDLEAGRYDLIVGHRIVRSGVLLPPGLAHPHQVVLRVAALMRYKVRVRDPAGTELFGVRLMLEHNGVQAISTTDAQGIAEFEFAMPSIDDATLSLVDSGPWGPMRPVQDAHLREGEAPQELTLTRAGVGRLVSPEGTPLASAVVEIVSSQGATKAVLTNAQGRFSYWSTDGKTVDLWFRGEVQHVSNVSRMREDRLLPLGAKALGVRPDRAGEVVLRAQTSARETDRELTVLVQDPTGAPLKGIRLTVRPLPPGVDAVNETDAQGRVHLSGLHDRSVEVSVLQSGEPRTSAWVTPEPVSVVPAGQAITLRFGAARSQTVTGVVLSSEGTPLSSIWVVAHANGEFVKSVQTNDDGRFTITVATEAPLRLAASMRRAGERFFVSKDGVRDGDDVTLRLE